MFCNFFKKRHLRKNFLRILKQRTHEEWKQSWQAYCLREANIVCRVFAWYLKLPNHYLFPEDDIHKIFLFEIGQMEDIAALLMIESFMGSNLENIGKFQKMRDFLIPCSIYGCIKENDN